MILKLSRRTLISSFLTLLFVSCKDSTNTNGRLNKQNDLKPIRLKIGKMADFKSPYTPLSIYRVAIIRVTENSQPSLKAISLLCTHQTCLVNFKSPTYECPCHGSIFDRDGTVLKGPAVKPLNWKKIEIEGDDIFLLPDSNVDKSWSLKI